MIKPYCIGISLCYTSTSSFVAMVRAASESESAPSSGTMQPLSYFPQLKHIHKFGLLSHCHNPAPQHLSNAPGLRETAAGCKGRFRLCNFADCSQARIPQVLHQWLE